MLLFLSNSYSNNGPFPNPHWINNSNFFKIIFQHFFYFHFIRTVESVKWCETKNFCWQGSKKFFSIKANYILVKKCQLKLDNLSQSKSGFKNIQFLAHNLVIKVSIEYLRTLKWTFVQYLLRKICFKHPYFVSYKTC